MSQILEQLDRVIRALYVMSYEFFQRSSMKFSRMVLYRILTEWFGLKISRVVLYRIFQKDPVS